MPFFLLPQDKYPWLRNLSMVIDIVVNETICNVTLNGITLNDSTWTLYGLNLIIVDAIVTKTSFILLPGGKDHNVHLVNISNSSFEQIKASRGFIINISNCKIDGNTILTSTLIYVVNCNVNIENSIFFNQIKYNKGPAIVNAVTSHIEMVNVIISQNYALDGLMRLSNNSILKVQNSIFSHNGLFLLASSVFILKYSSVLFLSNCKCDNNGAIFGTCILASGSVTIIAKHCTFIGNHAAIGGVIYWKKNVDRRENFQGKEFAGDKAVVDIKITKKIYFVEEYKSKFLFDSCAFAEDFTFEDSVLHLDGCPVEIFMNNCYIGVNLGFSDRGSIFIQGQRPSAIKVHIQRCLFYNNIAMGAAILSISQAHVNIHNCTINYSAHGLMSFADNSIVNITHLSVQGSPPVLGYIDIQNSVILYITNSQMTSFIWILPNGFFVFARNNCSVYISNSIFGDGSHSWIITNVFGVKDFSNLNIRNCNFKNSAYSYSKLLTASLNSKVILTNCSVVKTSGLEVTHNSELQIKQSYIVNSTDTWQKSALIKISDNSHMRIENSSIKNNILQSKNLIYITSNSSLTLSNCLYSENILTGHIVLSGGNITILNTRFVNNSVIETVTGPEGILVAYGTCFTIIHTLFNQNKGYGNIESLIMTISADTIFIQSCSIKYSFLEIPLFSFAHSTNFIIITYSRSISVVDTILHNNSISTTITDPTFLAIFRVLMTNRIPGSYIEMDNCTFGKHDMIYVYIQGISDVLIDQSLFYLPRYYNSHAFYVIGLKSLRLWDSMFYDQHKITALYFEYDFSYPKETNFLTLNTRITLRKTTLETSAGNFLQKAENKGIIDTSFFAKRYHEETSYAAS